MRPPLGRFDARRGHTSGHPTALRCYAFMRDIILATRRVLLTCYFDCFKYPLEAVNNPCQPQ
jgi:hypothetical protein